MLGSRLLRRFKVDDVVGAIPVHLFAGIWGTFSVALFANSAVTNLAEISAAKVYAIQLGGAIVIPFYAFIVMLAIAYILKKINVMRVSEEAEIIGLNIYEHGTSTAVNDLLAAMDNQRNEQSFATPIEVEQGTEIGKIASCLLYTSPSPRDRTRSRMPSSA